MCRRFSRLFFISFLFLVLIPSIAVYDVGTSPDPEGSIHFQPNIIDDVSIHFVEEFFRFRWFDNRFDLKLSIGYNDTDRIKEFSLRDFWEKTDRLLKWKEVLNRTDVATFGYNITGIPSEIADRVLYLLWEIEEPSFDASEIILKNIDTLGEFNLTEIHLPDNLVLSYEDLFEYGFSVVHPDKFTIRIENVTGLTSWNLDPISFSSPIITITGYSTEASSAVHNDIYNAMLNSTFQKTEDQYFSNARIVIGDGENRTWFTDSDVQVQFNSSVVTANYQFLYEVKENSYLRFGIVIDNATKRTRSGVSIIAKHPTYHTCRITYGVEVYLYSSFFNSGKWTPNQQSVVSSQRRMWNCVFQNVYISGTGVDGYNLEIIQGIYGLRRPQTSTWNFIRTHTLAYNIYFYTGYNVTIQNVFSRNCTYTARIINPVLDSKFINWDSDKWTFNSWVTGTGELYRQYSFNLTVLLDDGSPIQYANVTIQHYGENAGEDFNGLTDSNGEIPDQIFDMGFYNYTGGNTIYDYNPYNIQISNVTGYCDYSGNFTLDTQTDLIINLHPEPENWIGLTLLLGLLCFVFLVYALAVSH